ncbi:unnamed protein product [Echinostoma caproni]|uniref:LITAF domain-containing protein n=1 Tax=Echinostoma caproni TaxID=27848 RepID=A0A183A1S2_9TREM|nr:unnamed protein product [Echinostoma caproni]
MFASDLGELFSGVGGASGTHVTGIHSMNNGENNARNSLTLSHTSTEASSEKHQNTAILSGVPKTVLPNTATALEDLFSSEYEICTKPAHMNPLGSSNPGPSVKTQSQTRNTASGNTALTESATPVGMKQAPVVQTHSRGALRCPVCDKVTGFFCIC